MSDNLAYYGPNMASLPWNLEMLSQTLSFLNFSSGEKISSDILVGLWDRHRQLINNDYSSIAEIKTIDLNSSIIGITKVIAIGGIFKFSDLKIIGKPNLITSIKISS